MLDINKILHHIIPPVIAAMGMVAGLASCSGSDDPAIETTTDNDDENVVLSLTINTGNDDSSRATVEYGEDEGSSLENYIDLSKLHIYYSANHYNYNGGIAYRFGGPLAEFDIIQKERVDKSHYRVTCSIKRSKITNMDCRIVVSANWEDQNPPSSNLGNIGMLCIYSSAVYNYTYGQHADNTVTYFTPTEENPLPMYGIKQLSLSELNINGVAEIYLGTIDIVRAMSKIVIKDSTQTGITGVVVTSVLSTGMCAPAEMYCNTVNATYDYINIPHEQAAGIPAPGYLKNVPFKKMDDGTFVIYIPEYRTISRKDTWGSTQYSAYNETKIAITIGDRVHYLEFKDYTTNKKFDIVRNHIYIYEVSTSAIYYVVKDWSNYTSPTITFD